MIEIIKAILKFFTGTVERPSPQDWVKAEAITSDANAVVAIDLKRLTIPLNRPPKVWIPYIPDTNSMDGVFDFGNNNILISCDDPDDQRLLLDSLKVGDIAVYRTSTIYAIHRIIKIADDSEGKFFRFKGDNNPTADPGKIRPNQIQYVSVGTIY